MERRRILLVANTLPPRDLSGAGEQVLQLAWGLEREGHEVEVLGRRATGLGSRKGLFPLLALGPVYRALHRFRPHVVQVHESDGGLVALLVALLGPVLEPRPRLVALLQVSYFKEWQAVRALRHGGRVLARPAASEHRFRYLRTPPQILLGLLSASLADVVLAPSRVTAEEIQSDYGVTPVQVLPNVTGAPVGGDAAAGSTPPVAGRYLLYVGRLRLRKGVEVLLEAMAELRREGRDVPLVVVGDGERGELLRRRASQLGLAQSVHFVGRRSPSEMGSLWPRAAALVVPSLYEGMPLVILEAMARRVPVIASRVSGIPEVVLDPETGWLVDPGAPESLVPALRHAWQDPEEGRRRAEAGWIRVERHFQPARAARDWSRHVYGGPTGETGGDVDVPTGSTP